MILVNKAVIQEIHRLIKQLPSTDTDNAIFARQVFASITEHTRKYKVVYSRL